MVSSSACRVQVVERNPNYGTMKEQMRQAGFKKLCNVIEVQQPP